MGTAEFLLAAPFDRSGHATFRDIFGGRFIEWGFTYGDTPSSLWVKWDDYA